MIGIFIDDDRIAFPVPIRGVIVIVRGDAEVEIAEPEAVAASAAEAVNMAAAKAAGEAAVLPRAIDVIVGIIATGIVTDPSVVVMDVRGLRVIGPIAERAIIFLSAGFRRPTFRRAIFLCAIVGRTRPIALRGSRTVGGNVAAAHIASAAALLPAALLPSRLLPFALLRPGATGREKRKRGKREKQGKRA